MLFKVAVFRDDKAIERKKPYTAEVIAQNIIKQNGFVGRAFKFDCPEPSFQVTTMACYKMVGTPIFNKEEMAIRSAVTVVAIGLNNNTQGFAYVGEVIDDNAKLFDSDSTYATKGATGAAAGMFKNSHLQMH
ncbi:hypothetical protein HYN24_07295 [Dechloromonas sp. HYN0024]|nr:hypothetical protein HYN24_07295 [Dechloromonas sp. HYN0024]